MRRSVALLAVVPLFACHRPAAAPPRAAAPTVTHYEGVDALQRALIGGDLSGTRAQALRVAASPPVAGLPDYAAQYVTAMQSYATAVAEAPDIPEAAVATARMGAMCGVCHAAVERGPRTTVTAGPMPSDSVRSQMALHLWSLQRMWDGLVIPSDRAWTHGALGLNSAPHYQHHVARNGVSGEAADTLAARLFALGQRAALAGHNDRVTIYGEFLATCASCHQRYRVRLPAPRSSY